MKMITKRTYAIILSLAMVFTSLSTDFIKVEAEDFSQYFTFESYREDSVDESDSYNKILNTLGEFEAEIEGVTYIDYALKSSAGGNAAATCNNIQCDGIIDGSPGGGYQASSSRDVQSMIVDLGRVRSISLIQLSWETASAQTYAIDFSLDGKTWTTVAYLENCLKTGKRCDKISLVTPQNTKFVRMQGLKRQTGYAYNLFEIGVYCASGKADGADPIAAYTYTSEQITAINNSIAEAESEAASKAEWESYQAGLAKYVNTETNIAKGAKVYPSSCYKDEGKPECLTDGNLSKFASTA